MATMKDLEREMILNDRHAEVANVNEKIRHLEQQRAKIQKEVAAKQAAERAKEPPKKRPKREEGYREESGEMSDSRSYGEGSQSYSGDDEDSEDSQGSGSYDS